MDWLKDKKNQPYVALILAVVIVGAGFFVWKMMSPGPSIDVAATQEAAPPDGAEPPPDMPADTAPSTGAPAPGSAAAQGDQVAAQPMETWRADPFLPVGYKPPPKVERKPTPRIADFPFIRLPVQLPKDDVEELGPEPVQPTRRMAGVLLNDRVFAIIESNGQSQIVQPGDVLSDRLARVEKIEPDKVTLKTLTARPRYLVVRMASAPRSAASPAGDTTRTTPRGPIGMPGRSGPPVMPMPMPPGAGPPTPPM